MLGVALFGLGLSAGEGEGYGGADGLVSLRRNAVVALGGEVRVDYAYRRVKSSGRRPRYDARTGDLAVRHANLRLRADVHPNVTTFFKIDLSGERHSGDRDALVEEALVVMRAVGGTGLELFAGKGRAPYGQDITLGMVQSYQHSANTVDSAEGPVFLTDPHRDGAGTGAPMRPGQFERTFLAGASYEWNERWRIEAAAFRPERRMYRDYLANADQRDGSDIGGAARLWWRPTEDLTVEASAVWARSSDMAKWINRTETGPDARMTANGRAVSLGFDWRRGPWRVFGEAQKGWDWNFTRGYVTRAVQAGVARELSPRWRLGAMAEALRIVDESGRGSAGKNVDRFYKLTFNVRYAFSSGVFLLAEYGREWRKTQRDGRAEERRQGDFLGVRLGFTF